MKSENYPQCRTKTVVTQDIKDEVLIYDLRTNRAFCLNRISALVWNECDGTKSVRTISENISKSLKMAVSEDLVWMAVQQFKSGDLLDKSEAQATPFDGFSRREVIKRVGLASMVMLPVISGVIAPSSLSAQSLGNCFPADNSGSNSSPGCPCLGTFDCCGICSAGKTCTNAPRGGAPGDPGANPSCFAFTCSTANNSGSDSQPGCPCIGTFDCCGICSGGFCSGAPRPSAPGDPGAFITCP